MSNLFCYMFGHSIKHKYSDTEPIYIKFMYCSRGNCDYKMQLS
jgi:hypothetical protein